MIPPHLTCEMLEKSSGVEFKRRSDREKENRLVFVSSVKRETRKFHTVVMQSVTAMKCIMDASAELLFCLFKAILLF